MFFPKKETVYFSLNQGGLGDQIARMTVVDYALKHYPWLDLRLVLPDYAINLYKHHFPNLKIYTFKDFEKINIGIPLNVNKADPTNCTIIRQHLVKQAFATLLDVTPVEPDAFNYVKLDLSGIDTSTFNLPEKYAVVTCMSTVDVRAIPAKIAEGISSYLLSKGICPVFLGKTSARANDSHTIIAKSSVENFPSGLNLLDKTSLLQAAKIMRNAEMVVGLDNGLLHLAATADTNVPIISGYTTVHPEHRVPMREGMEGYKYKSIIPPNSLECRFCQSTYNFVYGVDFRFCVNKTNACTNQMKLKPWLEAISDVLNDNYCETIYKW